MITSISGIGVSTRHARQLGWQDYVQFVDATTRHVQTDDLRAISTSALSKLTSDQTAALTSDQVAQLTTRGIQKQGVSMVTSTMLGAFRDDPSTRREFLSLIGSVQHTSRE